MFIDIAIDDGYSYLNGLLMVPSGELILLLLKDCLLTVDLPSEDADFPVLYVTVYQMVFLEGSNPWRYL